jgi:hypothetical protein
LIKSRNEVDVACSTHEEWWQKHAIFLLENLKGRDSSKGPTRRWEDNITMDLGEIG